MLIVAASAMSPVSHPDGSTRALTSLGRNGAGPALSTTDELGALDRAIEALEAQRFALGDAVVDVALAPLLDKRRTLSDPGTEQRKLVTVLFADLVDSTVISQALDPEDVREIVNRYFSAWRTAIEHEGGVVEKFIGDAVMAVFGIPRAREDDPHRAIRAALAMRQSLDELAEVVRSRHEVDLEMRVGIDTGEVVVSTLDERGDGDLVVVGDTVNRAARLQSEAPVGGILISTDTFALVRGSFGLQRMEGLRLKGFPEPVDAFAVLTGEVQSFWPETRGIEGVTTQTVGRELELGRLTKLFGDVGDEGQWRFVTLMGEAGIGKSRLLHDFETWLAELPDGVWVIRGRASPATEDVAHGLLRSALAERLRIQATDTPAVVRHKWTRGMGNYLQEGADGRPGWEVLAAWLGFDLGADKAPVRSEPEALQRRGRRQLIDLLARLAMEGPVVVLLEDLHWADSATLDWMEEVASNPPAYPLMLLATARPSLLDQRPHWGEGLDAHTLIRVEPLSKRESRQLVADILQRAPSVPADLSNVIVDASEGNPFFVEELVNWLIDRRVITPGPTEWTITADAIGATDVPATLRGVLQARLDSLGRPERDVVERASVVGRVFWDRAVATLADQDPGDDDEAYSRLRSKEVVFQRPTSAFDDAREFSFRHALMRDVAYDGLLRSRRRRYHSLAARWLEEVIERSRRPDEHAAVLAHHLEEAGEDAAAARWYLRAGEHAAAAYANESALRLFASAERVAGGNLDLRFDILCARESVLNRVGRRDEQRALLDELADFEGIDDVRRARARIAEAWWRFYHSEFSSTIPVAEAAADLARSAQRSDLELEALLLAARAMAFHAENRPARTLLETILEQARSAGHEGSAAEAHRLLGVVATNLGEFETAIAELDLAEELFRRLGDLDGQTMVTGQKGAVLMGQERYDEAREALEHSLELVRATGHRLREGIIIGNLASIAIEQWRLDEALAMSEASLEMSASVDDKEGVVSARHRLGDVARLTGDLVAARTHLEAAIREGIAVEVHYFVAFAAASLAIVDLTEGKTDAARRTAEVCVEEAMASEVPHAIARATLVDGLTVLHLGRAGEAIPLLRLAVSRHEEAGHAADAIESRAALALALLDAGEIPEARTEALTVLSAVASDGASIGSLEPGRAVLSTHAVLAALEEPRRAEAVELAHRLLDTWADRIADPEMRRRFLDSPVSRELAAVAD